MIKTVNEHLLDQIGMLKGTYGMTLRDRLTDALKSDKEKYKRHNRRVNFLLRINQSHGRDHRLTMGEIDSRRINPI